MTWLDSIPEELATLLREGGWVFGALLVLAFGIAFALLSLWEAMRFPGAPILSSSQWRTLLSRTERGTSLPEDLQSDLSSSPDPGRRLQEIEQQLFAVSERRFPFVFVMIGASPLIGLLGTVSGMFTTFRGMASDGAAPPIEIISTGISEALITTQAGLVIGVPTYMVAVWMRNRHEGLMEHFAALSSELRYRLGRKGV
jgi:biopolymer transport protein ExbB